MEYIMYLYGKDDTLATHFTTEWREAFAFFCDVMERGQYDVTCFTTDGEDMTDLFNEIRREQSINRAKELINLTFQDDWEDFSYPDYWVGYMNRLMDVDIPASDEKTKEPISVGTGVLRECGYYGWAEETKHRPNFKANSYARNKDRR